MSRSFVATQVAQDHARVRCWGLQSLREILNKRVLQYAVCCSKRLPRMAISFPRNNYCHVNFARHVYGQDVSHKAKQRIMQTIARWNSA